MTFLSHIKAVLTLVHRCSRRYLPLSVLECLVHAASTLLKIIFPMVLVNFLLNQNYSASMHAIFVLVILLVALEKGNSMYSHWMDDERSLVNLRLEKILSEKLLSLDYSTIHEPEILDLKAGASYAVLSYRTLENALKHIKEVLSSLFIVVTSCVLLFAINIPVMIILILGAVLQIVFTNQLNKKLSAYFQGLYKINRKFDWFSALKSNLAYQKDIRLFEMKDMIVRKIESYNKETIETFEKMNNITFVNTFQVATLNTLLLAVGYLMSGAQVIRGVIGFGEFALLIGLVGRLSEALVSLSSDVTSAFQMIKFLEPVISFVKLPDKKDWGNEPLDSIRSIEFRNVSFKYPHSESYALRNISFELGDGAKMAIVGPNASGKTTIVKLICALYEPNEGEILINGKPMREYDYAAYISTVSVVFQDYNIYDFTVADNIALSCVSDKAAMDNAIEQAKLQPLIASFPQKERTLLSLQYEENGINISGGQKQRLAIARAFYKNGSLFIFDEPASSLDAVAEYETYLQYNDMSKDKLCIYISHKMATTRFCDKILVLNKAQVDNCDSHENLLKDADSLYSKLYLQQKKQLQQK